MLNYRRVGVSLGSPASGHSKVQSLLHLKWGPTGFIRKNTHLQIKQSIPCIPLTSSTTTHSTTILSMSPNFYPGEVPGEPPFYPHMWLFCSNPRCIKERPRDIPQGILSCHGCRVACLGNVAVEGLGTTEKHIYIYIPMDTSTFSGSVWGIIYYNLEG